MNGRKGRWGRRHSDSLHTKCKEAFVVLSVLNSVIRLQIQKRNYKSCGHC
jgi:hypothetical protein